MDIDSALENFRTNGRLRLDDGSPAYADMAVAALAEVEPTHGPLLALVEDAKHLGIVDAILDTHVKIKALGDVLHVRDDIVESMGHTETASWKTYYDAYDAFVGEWLGGSDAGEAALGQFIASVAMPDTVAQSYGGIETSALGGALLYGDKGLPTVPEERKMYRHWTRSLKPGTGNHRVGKLLRGARRWAIVWTAHDGVQVDALRSKNPLFKHETVRSLSRDCGPFNRQFGLRFRRTENPRDYTVRPSANAVLRRAPTQDKAWSR